MWISLILNVRLSHANLIQSEINFPLTSEPGEGFSYGVSTDWAGLAVERVNNIRLGDYMKTHIWDPLGMPKTTFRPKENEAVRNSLIEMTFRSPTGELTLSPEFDPLPGRTDDMGGAGTFSCAADYIKVLISLLKNDGKLLKPETVDHMFKPHLEDRQYLRAIMSNPAFYSGFSAGSPPGIEFDHALGGFIVMEEIPGQRSKGTVTWGGMPNLNWVGHHPMPHKFKENLPCISFLRT